MFTRGELIETFDLRRVNKSPAVFDRTKLNFFNRSYIKMLNTEEQAVEAISFLRAAGKLFDEDVDEETIAWLSQVMDAVINHIDTFSQISEVTDVIFQYDAQTAVESQEVREIMEQPGALEVVQALLGELPAVDNDLTSATSRPQ